MSFAGLQATLRLFAKRFERSANVFVPRYLDYGQSGNSVKALAMSIATNAQSKHAYRVKISIAFSMPHVGDER